MKNLFYLIGLLIFVLTSCEPKIKNAQNKTVDESSLPAYYRTTSPIQQTEIICYEDTNKNSPPTIIFLRPISTELYDPFLRDNDEETDSNSALLSAEVMPEFPGGTQKMQDFIYKNLRYPKDAKDKDIRGKVFISFIVDTIGQVTEVKVLRGIGGGCDEEAVRVIKSMPRWKPGVDKGKKVNVQFNFPIKFASVK